MVEKYLETRFYQGPKFSIIKCRKHFDWNDRTLREPYSEFLLEWTGTDRGLRKAVALTCREYLKDDNNFPKYLVVKKDNLTEKFDSLVGKVNRFENSSPRIVTSKEIGKKKQSRKQLLFPLFVRPTDR